MMDSRELDKALWYSRWGEINEKGPSKLQDRYKNWWLELYNRPGRGIGILPFARDEIAILASQILEESDDT